jgi:hypothetical protein
VNTAAAPLVFAPLHSSVLGVSTPTAKLEVGRSLLAFNWLLGAYAHRDWLGPWGDIVLPRHQASMRLIRRLSLVLLERHQLRHRHLREVGQLNWLMQPYDTTVRMADALGTALLGGWVQRRLERREVALQMHALGALGRQRALGYAQQLRHLPFATLSPAASAALQGPHAVFRLGVSCMSSLLDDPDTGAQERFAMRFAMGTVVPMTLSSAQRDEAQAVLQADEFDKAAP